MMPHNMRRVLSLLLVGALLSAAGWILYAGTLSAPFLFDDHSNIVNNPFIRMTRLTPEMLTRVSEGPSASRPVAMMTFAINYFFGQYQVAGYHLVNILIHVLCAFFVFLISRQTLLLCDKKTFGVPFITALLWLVHPLHTQSVTYLVQRMNALAALFYLIALFCYIKARRTATDSTGSPAKWVLLFLAVIISGLLGIASKEIVVTLPVMIFFYEWFFFQAPRALPAKLKYRWWIGIIIIVTIPIIIYVIMRRPEIWAMYDKQDFTMMQRLLTEPGVVLYYLSLLAYPHPERLQLIYNFPLSQNIISPPITLLSILALVMLITVSIIMGRRRKIIAFAIVWYLVCLAVESSFIGLALAFEHRTYLPSVFPIFAACYLLLGHIRPKAAGVLILSSLIGVLGFWTYERNQIWTNRVSLWQDSVNKAPTSAPATNNLGLALKNAGVTEKALQLFKKTVRLDPDYAKAYNNIGIILRDNGQAQKALPYFEKAIALDAAYPDAHYNLGLALFDMGRIEESTLSYKKALAINPLYTRAHNNIGINLQHQNETEEAIAHFKRALAIDPYFEKAYNNLGISFFRQGYPNKSVACFQKALLINPAYLDARNNLGKARQAMRLYGATINEFSQTIRQNPANIRAIYHLAQAYQKAGMIDKAIEYYEHVLSLDPDEKTVLLRLAGLYAAIGMDEAAIIKFESLSRHAPKQPAPYYALACLYARQHQTEKALATLKQAVDKGFNNWTDLKNNPDLETIRQTPYYEKLKKNNTIPSK